MKRPVTALVVIAGVLAIGAVAQVTREEFDTLAGDVRRLRAEVALLKVRQKALVGRMETLEAPAEEPVPDVFQDDIEWKAPEVAPFAIEPAAEPQSGALDGDAKPAEAGRENPQGGVPITLRSLPVRKQLASSSLAERQEAAARLVGRSLLLQAKVLAVKERQGWYEVALELKMPALKYQIAAKGTDARAGDLRAGQVTWCRGIIDKAVLHTGMGPEVQLCGTFYVSDAEFR